jgi:RNA polymerase sigma-70 factor (ECF subfamily)
MALFAGVIALLTEDRQGGRQRLPEAPPLSEERVLIRRAVEGDPLAFRRLFEDHAPPVRRFIGDLLRDDAAADEAAQETFVRAHARLASLRDDEKLLPWLFGIARRVCMEEQRARRRQPLAGERSAPEEVDPSLSPEGLLLSGESDRMLSTALEGIDEERRTALVLRIDHGLDYGEIAAVMGWPAAKVKNEIHRARLELRARLGKYVGGV